MVTNLRKTNLNLLPVLRELLRHRNVTNAARALNLSQPAVSNALAQLRSLFHDELLIPHGRTLQPSALAERMLPRLEMMLGGLEQFIAPANFDPAKSEGAIKIATADYVILLLGAELINQLSVLAPALTIEFSDASSKSARDLKMGDIDLFIAPRGLSNIAFDEFSVSTLFEDDIVCIADANEAGGHAISAKEFVERKLVLFTPTGSETLAFFETVLQHAGVTPRNIVRVPSFLVIPYLVQGTGSIALLQRRLAERLSGSTSIRIMSPPLSFPRLEIGMWWSPAREHDPSHMWLRRLISQICETQFA
jgi:DNA-binding transcriptional LysR family regulator